MGRAREADRNASGRDLQPRPPAKRQQRNHQSNRVVSDRAALPRENGQHLRARRPRRRKRRSRFGDAPEERRPQHRNGPDDQAANRYPEGSCRGKTPPPRRSLRRRGGVRSLRRRVRQRSERRRSGKAPRPRRAPAARNVRSPQNNRDAPPSAETIVLAAPKEWAVWDDGGDYASVIFSKLGRAVTGQAKEIDGETESAGDAAAVSCGSGDFERGMRRGVLDESGADI